MTRPQPAGNAAFILVGGKVILQATGILERKNQCPGLRSALRAP
jgi:hypothetical protein